jgi:hypothetical protein
MEYTLGSVIIYVCETTGEMSVGEVIDIYKKEFCNVLVILLPHGAIRYKPIKQEGKWIPVRPPAEEHRKFN